MTVDASTSHDCSCEFEADLFRTALVCSVGLAASFASFVIFRSGLETPYYAVGVLFLCFFAVTIGPILLIRCLKFRSDYFEFQYSLITLSLLLLPVAFPQIARFAYPFLGIVALWLTLGIRFGSTPRFRFSILFDSKLRNFIVPAFIVMLAVFAAVSAKHNQDVAIFLTEEMGALNLLHRDTVHHIAIANMSTLFGYPTAGLDGGSYLHYHYGMHYWFASIAQSLSLETIAAFPIIHLFVISFFQFSFLVFIQRSLALTGNIRNSRRLIVSLGLLVFSDFILFPGDTSVYYTSESLTLSSGLMFLAFIGWLSLAYPSPSQRVHLAQVGGFIILSASLLATKLVTAFFFSGALSIYLLLQRVQIKIYAFWILGAFLSSLLALYAFTPIFSTIADAYNPSHLEHPFRFRLGFQLSEKTGGLTTCVFVFLTAVLLKRYPGRVSKAQSSYLMSLSFVLTLALLIGFGDWFNSLREYLYVLCGLLSIASLVPVVTLLFDWHAFCLKGKRRSLFKSKVAALVIVAGLIVVLGVGDLSRKAVNLTKSMSYDLMQVWDGTLGKDLPDTNMRDYFFGQIRNHYTVFSPNISGRLKEGFWPALTKITQAELNTVSRERFALFVPPTNVDFWQYSDVDTCTYKPLYIPALLNLPLIKGLPPEGAPCEYVGIGHDFSGFSELSHSEVVTTEELCSYARDKGIERVLILANFTLPIKYRIAHCAR